MTIREVFEEYQIKANKKGVPSIYPDDFSKIFRYAVQNKVNKLFAKYETSNQLSDDLHNLHRHIIIDLYSDMPFPLNVKYNDGTPFVEFNGSQILPANGWGNFFEQSTDICTDTGDHIYETTFVENITSNLEFIVDGNTTHSNSFLYRIRPLNENNDSIEVGTIINLKTINGGSITVFSYTHCDGYPNGNYRFDLGDLDSLYINDSSNYFFKWNGTSFVLIKDKAYKEIDELKMLIFSPENYMHILGMSNVVEAKNNPECEKVFTKKFGVVKLTSDREVSIESNAYLEPKANRPYYSVKNRFNSVYPNFEVHYRKTNEIELVRLIKIELLYLKEPNIYYLEDEDLDGIDNTEQLEFQEYICQELVNEVTELILEQHSDQRMQSFKPLNESNEESRGNVQVNRKV